MVRLLWFLKPFTLMILASILLGIGTTAAGIGMLGTSAYLIASAALHPSIAELQVAIVGVRFFGLSRAGLRYSERLVSHSVNLRVLDHLRQWFYDQIESSPSAELQTIKSGDLLDRLMGNIEDLENFYVRVVSPVIVALVIGIGASMFVGGYQTQFGLILGAGLFVTGIILPVEAILLTRRTSETFIQSRSILSAKIVETIQGIEDLQAFGVGREWIESIKKESNSNAKIQLKLSLLNSFNSGLMLAVLNVTIVILLWVAIPIVPSGLLSGISLAVILMIAIASFESTYTLPQAGQYLTSSIEAGHSLFLLTGSGKVKQFQIDQKIKRYPKTISLEHVHFQYSEGPTFQLKDVNFILKAGKKTALIGSSGSGKTSIVNLLLRFWRPTEGSILVDGKNVEDLDPEEMRSFFSVISQSAYLFSATLRENLLLADPLASDEKLYKIFRQVGLEDWVSTLPDGLDTWVGDHGLRLSGGERQRVAIGRMLLQERPFIVLDEPDVHLDAETRSVIMDTIFKLSETKGILFISHDLSNIKKMDEILLLKEGQIIEKGNHKNLIDAAGDYAALFSLNGGEILNNKK
jgi:ATP-binding cassette subfamily C protein CydC